MARIDALCAALMSMAACLIDKDDVLGEADLRVQLRDIAAEAVDVEVGVAPDGGGFVERHAWPAGGAVDVYFFELADGDAYYWIAVTGDDGELLQCASGGVTLAGGRANVMVTLGTSDPDEDTPENCSDGVDNDCDDFVDCEDESCKDIESACVVDECEGTAAWRCEEQALGECEAVCE